MRRHDFLPLCAAVAAFLAVRCSTLPIESAGGSSGTEVSARAVEGTAIDTTGKPIGGALARLRRSSDLFGYYRNGTTGLQKNSLDTVTDLLGHFTLGPADTGAFTIELLSDDTLGATAACTVFAGDAIKRLAVRCSRRWRPSPGKSRSSIPTAYGTYHPMLTFMDYSAKSGPILSGGSWSACPREATGSASAPTPRRSIRCCSPSRSRRGNTKTSGAFF